MHRGFTTGLLLLTVSTGAIDAVSYLSLDKVFTGNMTGNVLFLGFALMGVAGIPFLNNAIALLGFVVGSILSGRIVPRGGVKGFPRASAWLLVGCGALAIVLAVVWTVVGDLPHPVLLSITFLLAAVMGAQVGAVKPIGNSDLSTVVVTNTLANLSRDSRLGGGTGQAWIQRVLAVIAMGVGAAIGAGMIHLWDGAAALFAAIGIYAIGTATLVLSGRASRA